jgi:hypothetical protein
MKNIVCVNNMEKAEFADLVTNTIKHIYTSQWKTNISRENGKLRTRSQ